MRLVHDSGGNPTFDSGTVHDYAEAAFCFTQQVVALPSVVLTMGPGKALIEMRDTLPGEDSMEHQSELAGLNFDNGCMQKLYKLGSIQNDPELSPLDGDGGTSEACLTACPVEQAYPSGVTGRGTCAAAEATCEYFNPYEGNPEEPSAPLMQGCATAGCCNGCGALGLVGSLVSRNFQGYEVMSKKPAASADNQIEWARPTGHPVNGSTVLTSRNKYFRSDPRALEVLDRVKEFLDVQWGSSGLSAVEVLDGYWTMGQANVRAAETLVVEGGRRHAAGTAFRLTYAATAAGRRDASSTMLLELANAVVAQGGPYVSQLGLGLGLGLFRDSVYFDVRKRPSKNQLVKVYTFPGAAMSAESLQRWVDSRGRPVRLQECGRVPNPLPARQHRNWTPVEDARRRQRRQDKRARARREEAGRDKRQLSRMFTGGDFCADSEEARAASCSEMHGAFSSARVEGQALEALGRCCSLCGKGGFVYNAISDVDEQKERACDQAVHWMTLPEHAFSAPKDTVDTCTFYPKGNVELGRSACYWGNCIDKTSLGAAILPAFSNTFTRSADGIMSMFGGDDDVEGDPEPLYDASNNPTPIHSVLQRTYAMHCSGRVIIFVEDESDIKSMRHTLVALMGYNEEVSHVEFQLGPDADYFNVVDALELLLEDWQDSLCRDHARDFLAPYDVQRVDGGPTEDTALKNQESDPAIISVSRLDRALPADVLAGYHERPGASYAAPELPFIAALLIETESYTYSLSYGFLDDASHVSSDATSARVRLDIVRVELVGSPAFRDDTDDGVFAAGARRTISIDGPTGPEQWTQYRPEVQAAGTGWRVLGAQAVLSAIVQSEAFAATPTDRMSRQARELLIDAFARPYTGPRTGPQ